MQQSRGGTPLNEKPRLPNSHLPCLRTNHPSKSQQASMAVNQAATSCLCSAQNLPVYAQQPKNGLRVNEDAVGRKPEMRRLGILFRSRSRQSHEPRRSPDKVGPLSRPDEETALLPPHPGGHISGSSALGDPRCIDAATLLSS